MLAFAIAAQIAGLAFVLRDAYRTQPAFVAFGLASAIASDGSTTVDPIGRESAGQNIARESRIVAIDGKALTPNSHAEAIAQRLRAISGTSVALQLRDPQGRVTTHVLTRSDQHRRDALRRNPIPHSVRMAVRLGFSLLSTAVLIGAAVLLVRRRPHDPEAALLSFAFLFMASVIDPPLLMWMGTGLGTAIDVLTGIWWTLIVIALAAFPSGAFTPRGLRWSLVIAPVLGAVLALDLQSDLAATAIGVGGPLVVLIAQAYGYRQLDPGIERQQIKWAAIGFAAGFVLLGLSLVLASISDQPGWSPSARGALYLSVVCVFSLAFALMPLGLLVSLLRYRLWEADIVIRRSANYAVLTLIVGFVFTLASDGTKAIIDVLLNREHTVLSTTLGAMVAVAVYAPARSFVLRWSKKRFDKPLSRVHELPEKLMRWRQTEDAPELGLRILGTIVDGLHAQYAALIAQTPTGQELVAAHPIADPQAMTALKAGSLDALPWQEVRSLSDDCGPVGTLMIGPRTDANRFNRLEREALDAVATPIAEALRAARQRGAADVLRALESRLARLEGAGDAKLA